MLKTAPAVFAVGNTYQIMVEVAAESLMSVMVGDTVYYDESNGIMNSRASIHRVTVPMAALDAAGAYTVCLRPLVERKPYYTETRDPVLFSFSFSPVPDHGIRVYHIADAHNRIDEPIAAARTFGHIDLLILNGDIIDHSGSPDKFANIYQICAGVTGGTFPVVFARGNHDMRGNFAERFADYTPNEQGRTYYTFTVGPMWGLVLDCGEDKEDAHPEYGHTVACHAFRQRQTDYIRSVIARAAEEYRREGIAVKLVVVHNPFTQRRRPPFDIEEEIYREWTALLAEHIKPDLMICGHTHKYGIHPVGGEQDYLGQPCPVVIASQPQKDRFIGGGFIVNDKTVEVVFTDDLGNVIPGGILE